MQITLASLHETTKQQVFDQVATHLLKQGKKSVSNGRCRYRGDEGTMCAAGCLIADDEYYDPMEGRDWSHNLFPRTHNVLITDLQQIHDNSCVDDWVEELITIAGVYGLDTECVKMPDK